MSKDPYFDEKIGTLRNLLGAKSAEELELIEPQWVFANQLELEQAHIPRTNDLSELLALHAWLFRGVFDWAGEIRIVDIKKNTEDAEFFLLKSKILDASRFVFTELSAENGLRGLSKERFVNRLAYYYDQLNYIHPFREGNGRVQRIFWSRVARDVGYDLDWDDVIGDENDEASRLAAELMDRSRLEAMFRRIVHRVDDES